MLAGAAGMLGAISLPLVVFWPYLLYTYGREALALPLFLLQPAVIGAIGAAVGVATHEKRARASASNGDLTDRQ